MPLERRKRSGPSRQQLFGLLTEEQKQALSHLERHGWSLLAIRWLFHQKTITLLKAPDERVLVLKEDGILENASDIKIRKSA